MIMKGIYKIVHIESEKYYVGSSIQMEERWRYGHRYTLRNNKHRNAKLQNAWNLHGEAGFKFIVVEELPHLTEVELLVVEQKYLDVAKFEKSKVYNLKFDASCPCPKNEKDYPLGVYTFIHKSGELFTGTCYELSSQKKIRRYHTISILEKSKSGKGWKLLTPTVKLWMSQKPIHKTDDNEMEPWEIEAGLEPEWPTPEDWAAAETRRALLSRT
jgi:hypothetical protein